MRRYTATLLTTFLGSALLLGVPVVNAQENASFKNKELKAEKGSYITLEKVELSGDEDTRIVKIKGSAKQGEKRAFKIKVDKDKGTYKTERVDKKELKGETETESESPELGLLASSYSNKVKVITDDPIGLDVCATASILYWTSDGDYPSYSSGNGSFWADPETSAYTSWYNSYKNSYEDSTTSYAGQRSVGSYYNWDFGSDDEQTTVDHDVLIQGFNNGTIDYEITSTADGESAYLLDDDIEIGF